MNLGDGLLFELENGKPRLIFSRQGADKKTNKLQPRPRPLAVLSSRQPCCVEVPESQEQPGPQGGKRYRDPRRRGGAAGGGTTWSTARIDTHLLAQGNPPKSLTNHVAEGGVNSLPQMRSSKGPDKPNNSAAIGRTALKTSTVTLTNGKPRIKNSSVTLTNGKTGMKNSTVTLTNGKAGMKNTTVTLSSERAPLRENVVCVTNEQLQQILSNLHPDRQEETQGNGVQSSQDPLEDRMGGGGGRDKCPSDVSHSAGPTGRSPEKEERSTGLMSWLTDTRRPHGRRELDGQVSLKQQRVPDALDVLQEETESVLSTRSSIREEPAAIRSTFKIGSQACPAEEAQSLERREEQRRRWVEELDKQREEAANRRREEKQQRKQTEDHDRWTMHFDSFQRKPVVPALTPAPGPPTLPSATLTADGGHRGELEVGRGPSSCLSLASDNCSWDCLSRASMDTNNTTKTSYMRTMTALLDPAQIEERERRRLKQQEQQRAIEAQMEEKRLRKDREETRRREEEREEEKRVEMERKMLELQHQLDRQREKEKEEQLSHQNEGLFQSIQRAQQEALRLKEQQRITDLAKKGHDVSKLVQAMKSNVWKAEGQDHEEEGAAERREQEENQDQRTISPRRDMAVQTDTDGQTVPSLPARVCVQTPDIPAEYQAPAAPPNSKRRTDRAGKENIFLTDLQGRGEGNPYDPFARTERRKDRRKPQWNTQRPSRQFVPASERYPAGLQRNRQENRRRRQADLLAQQEKNCVSRVNPTSPPQLQGGFSPKPNLSSEPLRAKTSPSVKVERGPRGRSLSPAGQTDRGRSPPVPAVKHRLQSQQPGCLSRPASHCSSSLPSHLSIHGGAKETAQ